MYYIAQIGGFTMEGTLQQVQQQWDEIKTQFAFILDGDTLNFFKAEKKGSCIVISSLTPVKSLKFEA